MFRKAIKINAAYTQPLYSIIRYYDSNEVDRNIGTYIILNEDGWILTCRHVADLLIMAEQIDDKYRVVKDELSKCKNSKERRQIMRKFGITKDTIIQMKNRIHGLSKNNRFEQIITHEFLDLALIKFTGKVSLETFPTFAIDNPDIGESVCKLGFPFPEFTCYKYDKEKDTIMWNDDGISATPIFPLDGMVVRNVVNSKMRITMFETSTPGLRGQSGGPVFNKNGEIVGIQSSTHSLDLGFDINTSLKRGSKTKHVEEYSFIHLGICINVQSIKEFLNQNNVMYNTPTVSNVKNLKVEIN
jgi:hypothetical protein